MSALAERPARPARVKAPPRPVPVPDRDYAHLSLEDLRALRAALQAEEGRVSYWRRIIQARLDVVRAGSATGAGNLDAEHLAPVLTDRRVSAGRTALIEVMPADDIPPLPSLAELWDRRVDEDDATAMAAFEADLALAEDQLSAYRSALHAKLADSTGQLIARYREQPNLALSALPLPPVPPARRHS